MQRKIPTLALVALCAAFSVASASATGTISAAELQKALAKDKKLTVIDVRKSALFARGHIPGAINIPATLCPQKHLPPLGEVVVCDAGLGHDSVKSAAAALAAKTGITVKILEGGYAAWESIQGQTTRAMGMKPEVPNYITYEQLKAADAGEVVLVDMRAPPSTGVALASLVAASQTNQPLTDLSAEFPGMRQTKSPFAAQTSPDSLSGGSTTPPLLVLIDNGDGNAQEMARTLKGNGVKRCVILTGGELILARHGQRGLQRSGAVVQQDVVPIPTGAVK